VYLYIVITKMYILLYKTMALVKLLALTILIDFGDRASGDFMGRVLLLEVSWIGYSRKKCRTLLRVPQCSHWGGGCLSRTCSWVYLVCPRRSLKNFVRSLRLMWSSDEMV